MNSKQAIKNIKEKLKNLNVSLKEEIDALEKESEFLEELKDPHQEYETEDFLVIREAFYDDFTEALKYEYTCYKWSGGYLPTKIDWLKETLKEWKEFYHTTTLKKILPEEMLEIAKKSIKGDL